MIDQWCVTPYTVFPDHIEYWVEHETGVAICGPQSSHATPTGVPSDRVSFFVTRPNQADYVSIVEESFPDTVFHIGSSRYVMLTEADFALIKLAAQ